MSSKRSLISSLATVEGNDDLLIEILLFLPAKSLVRFKLVNKRWRLLISAPSFCRLHTLHHPRRLPQTQSLCIFLVLDNDWEYLVYNPSVPRHFSLTFPCGISRVQILQSCNGLILLRCLKQKARDICYCVFNPTTMQLRDLSPLPFTDIAGIYLMFDPSLSPHYRVVSFVFFKTDPLTLIYVYDSETHKWKPGGERNKKAINFSHGINFNGGIYFVGRFFSCCFELDNNVSEIPNPPRDDAIRSRSYAVESNGSLLSFTVYGKQGGNLLIVSEMKKDEKRWTKKYEVDMNPILATCARNVSCRAIRPLCMVREEKEEDSWLMLTFDKKVIIYRFYDNHFEVLLDVKQCLGDGYLLIQSLAPV